MIMQAPKCDVTVIIPTYNRDHMLARALRSISQQTFLPMQVIIIDDGSSAYFSERIKRITDQFSNILNVALYRNENNQGANSSRNTAIDLATTKYLAFLDSDDLWLPTKLERQISEINSAKEIDSRPVLSATGRYRINSSGEVIAVQISKAKFTDARIIQSNFIGTLSSIVVETEIAKQIGKFDTSLKASQDWDFYIRVSKYVQYIPILEPLCIYADHNKHRITGSNRQRIISNIRIYKKYADNAGKRPNIYLVLAEDLQQIGKNKLAARFYVRSLFSYTKNNGLFLKIASFCLRLYFAFCPVKSLRNMRYERYLKSKQMLLRREECALRKERDMALISELLSPTTF